MSDETKRIEDEEMDVITLEFDDGTEVEAEIMGIFDVPGLEGKEYIALIPDDDTDDVGVRTHRHRRRCGVRKSRGRVRQDHGRRVIRLRKKCAGQHSLPGFS